MTLTLVTAFYFCGQQRLLVNLNGFICSIVKREE